MPSWSYAAALPGQPPRKVRAGSDPGAEQEMVHWAAAFVVGRTAESATPTDTEWAAWTAAWRSKSRRSTKEGKQAENTAARDRAHRQKSMELTASVLSRGCTLLGTHGAAEYHTPHLGDAAKRLRAWRIEAAMTATGMVAVGSTHAGGYNGYGLVLAAAFNGEQQKRNTLNIATALIPVALRALPGLREIHMWAAAQVQELGTRCGYTSDNRGLKANLIRAHMLNQVDDHANFVWHDDVGTAETNTGSSRGQCQASPRFSVVMQLEEDRSAMQVYGFEAVLYEHASSSKIFLSAACHRSAPDVVCASKAWNKVALFYNFV